MINIKETKRSFVMYNDYLQHLKLLSMQERGELMTAVFEYAGGGEISIQLSPVAAMAFSFIRRNMDDDMEKYNNACLRNQQTGKKGGRPRKEDVAEKGGYSSVGKEECSPVEKEKYAPVENVKTTSVKNEEYSPVKYSPVETEEYSPVENEEYSLSENEKYSYEEETERFFEEPEKTERFLEDPKKTERFFEKPKITERFFEKPKKPDTDIETDTVTETVTETVTDTVTDTVTETETAAVTVTDTEAKGFSNTPVVPKGTRELEEEFNKFWEEYPKKAARENARKAYLRLKPDKALSQRMLEAVRKQKKLEQWREEKYIPNCVTWITGRRWEDVVGERTGRDSPPKYDSYD